MKKKLKSSGGETLIEVLVSVLIGALSIALLFGAALASGSMDRSAGKTDGDLYAGLSNAQTHTGEPAYASKVTISKGDISVDVPVVFYGGGGVLSYTPVAAHAASAAEAAAFVPDPGGDT